MADAERKPVEELLPPAQIELLRGAPAIPAPITPMDMLNRAVSQGADINVLEKLMALQERWESNQAKKAFDAAVADAKAEIPPIMRNATGHNDKRYADFSAIASVVDPILSKHGISYRFRTTQTDRICVTCVLSHREGHAEETTLVGPPDSTGNKNAIQAIGSTLSYLQRYSLVQMLGLAAAKDDDGKKGAGGEPITDDQLMQLREALCAIKADDAKFLQMFKIDNLSDLPAGRFNEAMETIRRVGKKKGIA